ncbi:hypothetical protein Cni_G23062 [Canna indica]|uniref:procollagen-proline 4-dioxygenase n=1 Tax=Canna indica TaxID=4628 RepID=A0AAQ3KZ11_9LILI|nr:hypothetical protein Cni_G23062 [Canna indica]
MFIGSHLIKHQSGATVRPSSSFPMHRSYLFLLLSAVLLLSAPSGDGSAVDPTRVVQLSWRPRAFSYKGFLSDEECDHLIDLARDKLQKSMVVRDDETGRSVMSKERTSSGMFLDWRRPDDVVAQIEERIAAWTFLPEENGEPIQVLHYGHGEKYVTHCDFFFDEPNQRIGGQRLATVLMYLSDVEMGGETVFPYSDDGDINSWANCEGAGFAVKPRKGDAFLFFSLHVNGTADVKSFHGSCPVIEGEKWVATKWIRVRAFEFPKVDSEA